MALVGALLAAGCGGGGDDADNSASSSESGERLDGREPTPLESYMESVTPSGGDSADEQRRVEQQIEDCMRAQGFEYVAVEPPDAAAAGELDEQGPWSLPPDEFAARYGYGMFTIDDSELPEMESPPEDPNQAAIAAMSDEERAAYEEALYGTFDETTGEPTTEGCSAAAYATDLGESAPPEDDFAELFEDMDALWAAINDDPRVTEATAEWADCMADAGHQGVSKPEDATNLVQQRHEELVPVDAAAAQAPEGIEGDGVVVGAEPPELDPDDLQALREYEIAVAVADRTCQDGDGKYADVIYEVQVEVEQQFIDEHREELDRYRETQASSGG